MKTELNDLLRKLYTMAISREEFLKRYESIENIKADENYCLQKLNQGYLEKDSEAIKLGMIIGFTKQCFSDIFLDIFCKMLLADWHKEHEDIAMELKELKDLATVECLAEAAELKFDYLDYDDTFQFARKCIKAISAIDTELAIAKLRNLAQSKNKRIREYAKKELKYKGLILSS
jgi:hypothetical protein